MEGNVDLTILHEILNRLVDFLNEFNHVTNCHLVNFITKNLFDNVLPEYLRDELLQLTSEELCLLPSCQLESNLHNINLTKFMTDVRRLTLPEVLENTQFLTNPDTLLNKKKFKFDLYMGVKKSHEVEEMACTVASCASDRGINCAVDIGSGKGYLSSLLSMYFEMKVYGLEGSDGNTQSAHTRQKNVKKHWRGILKKVSGMEKIANLTDDRLYTPLTCRIDNSTDLTAILHSNHEFDNVALCGLHTCGELASHSINMFIRCPQAKLLCSVGCCYHLMKEKFAINPYQKRDDPEPDFYGFPLSCHLIKKQFGLGRNARTLASQPVNRMADQLMMPKKALFWRALLQKIIWDKFEEIEVLDNNVGSIAKNCQNFFDYVIQALKRLEIAIEVSEIEANDYEGRFQFYERKMNAFFQFRCLFAPIVETVVILDRLCYLLEQEDIEVAKVVQLFNPTTSPRCFALIATKRFDAQVVV